MVRAVKYFASPWLAIMTLATASAMATPADAAVPGCLSLAPLTKLDASGRLPVRAADLARLRDFGMVGDSLPDRSPFSVSPDGHWIALVLRRADPASNSYCQGLVLVDATSGAQPRVIDDGGDFIRYRIPDLRGAIVPSGTADIITPAWSPDGQWIAYRKRSEGPTQVWIIRADGRDAHVVTASQTDIDSVAWSRDGGTLIYASWPALATAEQSIDEEGKGGWLYDRRILPIAGARPYPQQPIGRAYFALDVANGSVRAAKDADKELLEPSTGPAWPKGAAVVDTARDGSRAWAAPADPSLYISPTRLSIQRPGHAPLTCSFAACSDKIIGAWWSPDGRQVRFLRRAGWADSTFAFYRWHPRGGVPVKTFETKDVFSNCASERRVLICDHEASRTPRQIVRLDPETGRWHTIFDPNPEFYSHALGSVTRLHWRNSYGTACYGDLILPPDHQPGQRHPLIIVQYRTKGFLRGAIGDQYPIQAFAARGYAILSIERVPFWAEARAKPGDQRTFEQFQQENQTGWIDRRNVLSSLLTGIDLLAKLGVADPGRVGITGVSEAAMSTWFALNNSDRFKAAAVGSCCMDPKTTLVVGGEAWAEDLEQDGYPKYTSGSPDYWKPMSLAMNADHVTAPVLMQLSDDEFALGLEAYESLTEYKRAVEMRIFPGEHHYEWQPAHRLAIYQRNLDWFDFWLRGIEDPEPAKRDQYIRWRALRTRAGCSSATATSASICGLPSVH